MSGNCIFNQPAARRLVFAWSSLIYVKQGRNCFGSIFLVFCPVLLAAHNITITLNDISWNSQLQCWMLTESCHGRSFLIRSFFLHLKYLHYILLSACNDIIMLSDDFWLFTVNFYTMWWNHQRWGSECRLTGKSRSSPSDFTSNFLVFFFNLLHNFITFLTCYLWLAHK